MAPNDMQPARVRASAVAEARSSRVPESRSLGRRILHLLVPLPVRRALGDAGRAYQRAAAERRQHRALRRGLRAIASLRPGEAPPAAVLDQLLGVWANGGWPADRALLADWIRQLHIVPTGGLVLELGSGLTTLVAAAATRCSGVQIHTLEQNAHWASRVRRALRYLRARHVQVHDAPLRDYGPHDWYTIPATLPDHFDLVLCDGPPGSTRGGRTGCLSVVAERSAAGAVLLVDDAHRGVESGMVQQCVANGWELVSAADGGLRHATLRRS